MFWALFIMLIILSGISLFMDSRFIGYFISILIIGLTLVVNISSDYEELNTSLLIGGIIVIIISLILQSITRKIDGVELFYIHKKDWIFIIPIVLGFYLLSFSEFELGIFFKIMMLFIYVFVITSVYMGAKQIIFSYFLFWINYFWGKEEVYKNTKIKVHINKVRYKTMVFKSYYLEEHDNKQIKFSNKIDSLLEEKYAFIRRKNITNADALSETYRFTATLYVKISPVFKKVIVTKIKI